MSTLEEQVAAIREGDFVTATFSVGYGLAGATASGTLAVADSGALVLGASAVRYSDGDPGSFLVSIDAHTPVKRQIRRGDVIETAADAERFEIPDDTVFRTPRGTVLTTTHRVPVGAWSFRAFPVRCIDVPGDDA